MDELITFEAPRAWLVELPFEEFNRLIIRLAQQKHFSAALEILCAAYQCDREDAREYLERILETGTEKIPCD